MTDWLGISELFGMIGVIIGCYLLVLEIDYRLEGKRIRKQWERRYDR